MNSDCLTHCLVWSFVFYWTQYDEINFLHLRFIDSFINLYLGWSILIVSSYFSNSTLTILTFVAFLISEDTMFWGNITWQKLCGHSSTWYNLPSVSSLKKGSKFMQNTYNAEILIIMKFMLVADMLIMYLVKNSTWCQWNA